MMSDFRGRGMTPKNRILEGKNRTLGELGSKIVGHHLWMVPRSNFLFIFLIQVIKRNLMKIPRFLDKSVRDILTHWTVV